ncbi:regulatory protein RecX [Actinocatenispora thailandica]|uniref:Regulatory protein RecX n=1 Tax=Actinocatenispora thailandica TaxID=227318 RepID=A0A7R7HWL8_9ACTN|nr:regulatory protein RecX [Actinocatenispora thailandica]
MTERQPGRGRRRRTAGERGAAATTPPADPRQQARDICLRLLSVRPRTRAELATALRRRGIPDEDATAVLERYGEVGMIDDEAFAKAWVTSRHAGRGLARGALARELRQRGVDSSAIGSALTELDGDTEATMARALVDRRLRSMAGVPAEVAFRRLVGMLARKGYSSGLAVRTVRDALAARPGDDGFVDDVDMDALADSVGGDALADSVGGDASAGSVGADGPDGGTRGR